jgi:hypothetical protein
MNVKLFIIFFTTLIFLTSCSESKEKIEIIIQVEPEIVSLNDAPDTVSIKIINTSDTEWRGSYDGDVYYFNGNDWELWLSPEWIADELVIESNSNYILPVLEERDISTHNTPVGNYKIKFHSWYGEFSIVD